MHAPYSTLPVRYYRERQNSVSRRSVGDDCAATCVRLPGEWLMMREVLRMSGFLPFAGSGAARRASASWLRSWWRCSSSSSAATSENAEKELPQGASVSPGLPSEVALPAAGSPSARRLLMRDFIQQSLYHPVRIPA